MPCGVRYVGVGRRGRRGDSGARSVQERARLQIRGQGTGRSARTLNMAYMDVTLEVSKLSGWLNDDALCQETKEGHTVCGARYAGRQAGGGGVRRCKQRAGQGSTADWGQGTERSAR